MAFLDVTSLAIAGAKSTRATARNGSPASMPGGRIGACPIGRQLAVETLARGVRNRS
jgi:hypothetical protein